MNCDARRDGTLGAGGRIRLLLRGATRSGEGEGCGSAASTPKDNGKPPEDIFCVYYSSRTEHSYAIRTLTFELRCAPCNSWVSEHLTFPASLCGFRTNVPRPQTRNKREEEQPNIAFAKDLTLNLWFLGGSLIAGERVLLKEGHALSRRGTERLQIYSHLFTNLSVLFVQSELLRREELAAELWRRRFWEEGCW
jgi:hypothetical protein